MRSLQIALGLPTAAQHHLKKTSCTLHHLRQPPTHLPVKVWKTFACSLISRVTSSVGSASTTAAGSSIEDGSKSMEAKMSCTAAAAAAAGRGVGNSSVFSSGSSSSSRERVVGYYGRLVGDKQRLAVCRRLCA